MSLARRLAERLGKPGDHLSIDCIILGKPSGRLSEAAKLALVLRSAPQCQHRTAPCAIHARNRHSPPSPPCLPAACAARQPVCGDLGRYWDRSVVTPMLECTGPPCPWRRRCPRQRDHLVSSSTPFLARFGLEALATVRVEEDTGAVPRSNTGFAAFGALRAQFQQRAGLRQPPVRTFCQISWTQGAFRDRHERWVRDAVDAVTPSDE